MDSRGLAPTSFDDQDVGCGPVHASPSLGPMTGAIHNISTRHLHDIGTGIPDDRQFLRSWRRSLQDCLTQQNGRIIQFLITDVSGEQATADLTKRCTDVLNKYAKSTWSFNSSTRDLALPASTADCLAWVESEIGISPTALRDHLRKAVRLYANTAQGLAAAEGRLEEKLKRLETIVSRVNDLMFMEPTAALDLMTEPTRVYLDSILGKISIEEDYKELVEQYKRFTMLKGVVSLANFQRPANPTCTICMTKEVCQAVTPCGHTFCDECCRTQMTSCYICRVQIRDKIRLFFS